MIEYCIMATPISEIIIKNIECMNPPENEPVVILPRNNPASHA